MSSSDACIVFLLCLSGSGAHAEGYVLGVGGEGDSSDGRAVAAFGDFSLGEKTWLSATVMAARTEGVIRDNETVYASADLDHFFDPVGLRIGAAYWGDPDVLDSRDIKGSFYLRGDPGSLSAEFEKRYFEFDLQSDLLRGRTVSFTANGLGLGTRLSLGESVDVFGRGMAYDYSRNLRVQQDIDVLTFISRSRLSMINNLVDDRFEGGIEFRFGLRSIDFTAGRWTAAIDGSSVDSCSAGFLTPISDRMDAEFRLSFDDSTTYGRTTALSVYLYYFGGS